MDPVTHALIGMGISKLGGQPMSMDNPAFVGAVLGSMAPDLDIVLQKWGDYVYLKNHRGISHSIVSLAAFAGIITLCLMPFYKQFVFLNVWLWSFLGCLSHSGIDMLNSYGVQFLWPLYKKKLAFGLFIIFDPIVFLLLFLYLILEGTLANAMSVGLVSYIVIRASMLYGVRHKVKLYFDVTKKDVNIMPSMLGLFKWHFIVRRSERIIVGEKNVFKRNVKILEELKMLEQQLMNKVIKTPIAKFFAEFTPCYHIVWDDGKKVFKFIDVRYYIRNTFLHHATAKVNDDFEVIDQKFHPYSMKRNVDIPI
ncbi:MAG: inner rane protein [Clostridia bacterium]|jgi:inner membrane protein|nr:inner rane protein [Clostridia bacterium]